jgi:hypothetical protein
MNVDAPTLKTLIDRELERLSDARVEQHIRRLLVDPKAVFRNWDYGKPGEQYPCRAVLNDSASNTGICDHSIRYALALSIKNPSVG